MGVSALGRSVAALAEDAAPSVPDTAPDSEAAPAFEGPVETLREPISLGPGDVLADRRFVLAPDFRWTVSKAVIWVASPDVTIRNVEIVGSDRWLPRWNAYNEPPDGPPGICSGMCGIRLQGAPRVRIEHVSVRGLPGGGIDGFGLEDGVIRDVGVRDCFVGVVTRQYLPNAGLWIERVRVRDLWGPGPGRWPGVGGPPSLLRPGGFIGGDGIVCHSLRRALVRDSTVLGEQFGSFKLVNSQHTTVSGLHGNHLMVQGTSDLEWKIDKEPSRHTQVHDCVFDKRLGVGEVSDEGNGIQVSWHVHDLRIERCMLIGGGKNGHGIQFAGDAHGRVVGCTFDGFNGVRGRGPAYAVETVDGSSVNADFEAVNTFRNQHRIALRR